jgi:ribosomal protein S18 acetylase RimI-like enzyme
MMLDFGSGFFLRRATEDDHAALCEICLKTGNAGEDATWREDDPTLMGMIYAVPYQLFEPDLAFVLESPDGVSGYLFGALDTASFNARLGSVWYPSLRERLSDPSSDRGRWQGSDWARHAVHHPDLTIPAPLRAYPSHGHIDLLTPARGRGIGRRCMAFLEDRLAAAGSTGLFLEVHPRNTGAHRFYTGLGYRQVPVAGSADSPMYFAKHLVR